MPTGFPPPPLQRKRDHDSPSQECLGQCCSFSFPAFFRSLAFFGGLPALYLVCTDRNPALAQAKQRRGKQFSHVLLLFYAVYCVIIDNTTS